MSKGKWILKCVLGGIAFLLLVGLVTMHLWNWLIPAIFNGPDIRFVEALGLLLLGRILFGGWGRGHWREGGGPSWKRKYFEKLSAMSPADRERFKSRMREKWRCGAPDRTDGAAGGSTD